MTARAGRVADAIRRSARLMADIADLLEARGAVGEAATARQIAVVLGEIAEQTAVGCQLCGAAVSAAVEDLSSDGCISRAIERYLARAPGTAHPSTDGIKGILEPLWGALTAGAEPAAGRVAPEPWSASRRAAAALAHYAECGRLGLTVYEAKEIAAALGASEG